MVSAGQIFTVFFLIITFPIQLIYFSISKAMDKKHKWMDAGPWYYYMDTMLPQMQSIQTMIDIKKQQEKMKHGTRASS